MPEPSMGQPYITGSVRVSVGDLDANYGTDASLGVVILENGVPSPYIISPPGPFTIRAQVKTACPGWDIFLPNNLITEFHIVNLYTGVELPTSPYIVDASTTPPVEISPPAGSIANPGDIVHWFAVDSPNIPALAAGQYKIIVFGSGTALGGTTQMLFVHDDTVLVVS